MSKTIYVGRIPFDYTEEQVASIFQTAGPIQEIRFVFDKDTGKSKGFAFVEYFDAESAASAVRNLDNHPVGNMKLKVDFSNDNVGQKNPAGQTAFEYIAMAVNEMPLEQKRELLSDFKKFTTESRTQALELLQQSPQIAYALVQAMLEMGKIDQKHADTLLPAGAQPAAKDQKRSKAKKPTKSAGRQANSRQNTPQNIQESAPASTSAAAPSPAAMENAAAQPAPQDPEEIAMIRQVMAFTDDQVNSLPPEQRHMVVEIRTKVKRGEIRI